MSYNLKADENVNCWICDHFQRYERGETPQSCLGECRFPAPEAAITEGEMGGAVLFIDKPFPIIRQSPTVWCSKFVRTKEQNLPPVPPQIGTPPAEVCEDIAVLPDAVETFRNAPWNKKTLSGYVDSPEKGVACWNCDNFQQSTPTRSGGDCRFNPPSAFQIGGMLALDYWALLRFPILSPGVCWWCAKWQRVRHEIIDPIGGWDCPAAEPVEIAEVVDGGATITAANPTTQTPKKPAAKKTTAKKTTAKKTPKPIPTSK